MTVRELVARLEKMPQNYEVVVPLYDAGDDINFVDVGPKEIVHNDGTSTKANGKEVLLW